MSNSIGRGRSRWLTSTVFGIGMASLFSDLSHEAVTSVLPALLTSMGVAAAALGTIEGVADGLSSVAKLYGGWIMAHFIANLRVYRFAIGPEELVRKVEEVHDRLANRNPL